MASLHELLSDLEPELRPGELVFCSFPGAGYGDLAYLRPLASIREREGLTLVIDRETAAKARLECCAVFRKILLKVRSGLTDVGLTAAVSNVLAERGISANVIAGRYHDHVLVPAERAEEALGLLVRLSATARDSGG